MLKKWLKKIRAFLKAWINPTVVFFFIYAILLITPFLYSGDYALAGHDHHFHKHVIQQIGVALQGGRFPARVFPDFAYGFGYGIGIFYPPLSHIVGAVFTALPGFDVHLAVALVYMLGFFFSGYGFYRMMKYLGRSETAASIGGLLYMSIPYYLINVFYRDAYAEAFCAMLIPLVVIGMVQLVREKKFLLLALSYSAIIMAHNITALWILVFMILGCFAYIKHFMKRDVIIAGLKAVGITFLLTCFVYVPIIEHVFFNPGVAYLFSVVADNLQYDVPNNALNIGEMIYWPFGQSDISTSRFFDPILNQMFHNRMPLFIGAPLLIMFIASIIWPTTKSSNRLNAPFIVGALFCLFATTIWFPWAYLPNLLLNIQFPWRLLMFAGLFICVVAADLFTKIPTKYIKFPIIVIALVGFYYMVRIVSPVPVEPKITQPAEFIGVDMAVEYNPTPFYWDSQEQLLERGKKPLRQDGAPIKIYDFERHQGGKLSFNIDAEEPGLHHVELPLFFYKGYRAEFFPSDGGKRKILPAVPNERALVEISVPDSGSVRVRYAGTIADKVATTISITTLFLIILFALVPPGLIFRRFYRSGK